MSVRFRESCEWMEWNVLGWLKKRRTCVKDSYLSNDLSTKTHRGRRCMKKRGRKRNATGGKEGPSQLIIIYDSIYGVP